MRWSIAVHADDLLTAVVDASLRTRRRFLDTQLRDAGLDRLHHAAELFDLGDVSPRTSSELIGQPLNVITAAPRIDRPRRFGLELELELGVARNTRREVCWQSECFVERVRVKALRMTLCCGHRLNTGAHDIVIDILRCQRPSRRLAVRAQDEALRALWRER